MVEYIISENFNFKYLKNDRAYITLGCLEDMCYILLCSSIERHPYIYIYKGATGQLTGLDTADLGQFLTNP